MHWQTSPKENYKDAQQSEWEISMFATRTAILLICAAAAPAAAAGLGPGELEEGRMPSYQATPDAWGLYPARQAGRDWRVGLGSFHHFGGDRYGPYDRVYPLSRYDYPYRYRRVRPSRENHELRRAEFRERFESRARQFEEEFERNAGDEFFSRIP